MKTRFTIFLFSLTFFSLSCKRELEFNNPVDPQVELEAPSNVQVVSMSETSAIILWEKNNPFITNTSALQNEIQMSDDGYYFTAVQQESYDKTQSIITSHFLTTKTYMFRVVLKTDSKTVVSSSVSQILYFPAPSDLVITSMTTSQVNLSWTDQSSFETSFEIEQSTDGSTFSVVKTVSANITMATITGTYSSTTTYYFRVRAKSLYNISQYSDTPTYNIAAVAAVVVGVVEDAQVLVNGGTFTMGSPGSTGAVAENETPQHDVTLSNFYIGKFEITQSLWRDVVMWKQGSATSPLNPSPSSFTGYNLPVESISWDDIQTWLGYLNEMASITDETKKYRLPTEAEWEYAARGGTHWQDNYTYSGSNTVGGVAWCNSNSSSTTHNVGTKTANQLGIYDMSGNVGERVNDWYGNYGSSSQTNPNGPASGSSHVVRGGSCLNGPNDFVGNLCRVGARDVLGMSYYGFRIAKSK